MAMRDESVSSTPATAKTSASQPEEAKKNGGGLFRKMFARRGSTGDTETSVSSPGGEGERKEQQQQQDEEEQEQDDSDVMESPLSSSSSSKKKKSKKHSKKSSRSSKHKKSSKSKGRKSHGNSDDAVSSDHDGTSHHEDDTDQEDAPNSPKTEAIHKSEMPSAFTLSSPIRSPRGKKSQQTKALVFPRRHSLDDVVNLMSRRGSFDGGMNNTSTSKLSVGSSNTSYHYRGGPHYKAHSLDDDFGEYNDAKFRRRLSADTMGIRYDNDPLDDEKNNKNKYSSVAPPPFGEEGGVGSNKTKKKVRFLQKKKAKTGNTKKYNRWSTSTTPVSDVRTFFMVSEKYHDDLWWTDDELKNFRRQCLLYLHKFLQDKDYVWALKELYHSYNGVFVTNEKSMERAHLILAETYPNARGLEMHVFQKICGYSYKEARRQQDANIIKFTQQKEKEWRKRVAVLKRQERQREEMQREQQQKRRNSMSEYDKQQQQHHGNKDGVVVVDLPSSPQGSQRRRSSMSDAPVSSASISTATTVGTTSSMETLETTPAETDGPKDKKRDKSPQKKRHGKSKKSSKSSSSSDKKSDKKNDKKSSSRDKSKRSKSTSKIRSQADEDAMLKKQERRHSCSDAPPSDNNDGGDTSPPKSPKKKKKKDKEKSSSSPRHQRSSSSRRAQRRHSTGSSSELSSKSKKSKSKENKRTTQQGNRDGPLQLLNAAQYDDLPDVSSELSSSTLLLGTSISGTNSAFAVALAELDAQEAAVAYIC